MTANTLQEGQTTSATGVDEGNDSEFPFSDRDFERIRRIVSRETGIVITDAKRQMVYSRLARRLRALELKNFGQYCRLLDDNPQDEIPTLVNAITTNLTSFFREPHHFAHLQKDVIPEILAQNASSRRIRIWSAGCSTGEEAYSIALALREVTTIDAWDCRILATDIDTDVLARAEKGIYPLERVAGIEPNRLRSWFTRGTRAYQGKVRVSPDLSEMISFKRLNLTEPWPVKGPFDVIFCRNVVIYFDKETQRRIFNQFADCMSTNGYLYIGHSESLFNVSDRFKLIGQTIYQKKD